MPAIPESRRRGFFIWLASSSSTRRDASFTAARNQVLQHLLVLAGEDVRFNAYVHDLFLAVHLHRDPCRRRPRLPPSRNSPAAAGLPAVCRNRDSICWRALTSIRIPLGFVSLRKFFLRSAAAWTAPSDRARTAHATLACRTPRSPPTRLPLQLPPV